MSCRGASNISARGGRGGLNARGYSANNRWAQGLAQPIEPTEETMAVLEDFVSQNPITKDELEGFLAEKKTGNKAGSRRVSSEKASVPPAANCPEDLQKIKNTLPASQYRQEVLESIKKNDVVIISGGTGCGKTTQTPQFILDEAHTKNQEVRVIVTQPRRIAATSIAERVAKERGEKIGETVGYQVKLESRKSEATLLTYCTTGVLLRMLTSDPLASNITHIIMDEIHEREINTDYLLIAVRECLKRRTDLKVILMSATIEGNMKLFTEYFQHLNVGIIKMESRTFDVKTYHIEHILAMTGYQPSRSSDDFYLINDENWNEKLVELMEGQKENIVDGVDLVEQLEERFKEEVELAIPYRTDHFNIQSNDYIEKVDFGKNRLGDMYDILYGKDNKNSVDFDLLNHVIRYLTDSPILGSILVFLPGFEDIQKAMALINEWKNKLINMKSVCVVPLHSQMSNHDEAFKKVDDGTRKIILATNIAEASITIEDVIFVVDTGKAKEKCFDHNAKMSTLSTKSIAKSNALQRSGRAGRVANGYCFRLYSKKAFDEMPESQIAEMKRAPIYDVTLHAKIFAPQGMRIQDFLSLAPEAPEEESVIQSISFLTQIGAFHRSASDEDLDKDPEVTELGKIMARLPLDPQLAKMLIFGLALKCLGPIVNLVSVLACKDPFVLPSLEDRNKQENKKASFSAAQDFSDHLLYIRLARAFENLSGYKEQAKFCDDNFLNLSTMKMINGTCRQLLQELVGAGLVSYSGRDVMALLDDISYNCYSDCWSMVQAAIAGGVYPCVGVNRTTSVLKKVQTSHSDDAGLHPSSSLKKATKNNAQGPVLEFVAYQEMCQMSDSSLAMKMVTAIPSLTAFLFTGGIQLKKEVIEEHVLANEPQFELEGISHFYMGDWYCVEAEKNTMRQLLILRQKFMNYFMEGISNPQFFGQGTTDSQKKTLEVVRQLLESEKMRANFSPVEMSASARRYGGYKSGQNHQYQNQGQSSRQYIGDGSGWQKHKTGGNRDQFQKREIPFKQSKTSGSGGQWRNTGKEYQPRREQIAQSDSNQWRNPNSQQYNADGSGSQWKRQEQSYQPRQGQSGRGRQGYKPRGQSYQPNGGQSRYQNKL
ncbi:hypothetical protein GCK72_004292 [Caenorhabditis remanei]|uniref:Probable ATP-dependent RNA helicase spindle-E n=1 Tax=Caenorhabditis remanei TaxID=31234 RepID=A0A6A5HAW3_CAERE|nr:hypothetical protein GCK72_004292 [Caenorhabditis remanei]KAF1764345.1 hypothetical protein GCK72_004292 [Caenorhabditis remanei]